MANLLFDFIIGYRVDHISTGASQFDVIPINSHWDKTLHTCQEAFEQQRLAT